MLLDEAYAEFVGTTLIGLRDEDSTRILVVRTASKAYALAGLRVGFAMSTSRGDRPDAPPPATRLDLDRLSVTLVTEALRLPTVLAANLDRVARERTRLAAALTAAGWSVPCWSRTSCWSTSVCQAFGCCLSTPDLWPAPARSGRTIRSPTTFA